MIEQVLAGRYQILNPVNFSTASQLLQAQDLTLNRLVSVLRWPTDVDPQTIETFANLNEPGVIHVLDVFSCEQQYYVVSTEVKGEPLASYCRSGEFNPQIAANIVLSLALAVEVIHRKGWVVTAIKTRDIYLDEESNPTITYARLWRSDRDTDSIAAILQVLLEMLAFIDPSQLNEAGSKYLKSLADFAART
ncbi:MAG: hypothetical protein JWN30_1864, partial [Bacilli bacterium]|nr:hypothetical protein [Bacilli bacterium]